MVHERHEPCKPCGGPLEPYGTKLSQHHLPGDFALAAINLSHTSPQAALDHTAAVVERGGEKCGLAGLREPVASITWLLVIAMQPSRCLTRLSATTLSAARTGPAANSSASTMEQGQ